MMKVRLPEYNPAEYNRNRRSSTRQDHQVLYMRALMQAHSMPGIHIGWLTYRELGCINPLAQFPKRALEDADRSTLKRDTRSTQCSEFHSSLPWKWRHQLGCYSGMVKWRCHFVCCTRTGTWRCHFVCYTRKGTWRCHLVCCTRTGTWRCHFVC